MRLVFIVLTIIFSLIVFVIGFGWWDDQLNHVFGWLGLGIASFAASFLPLPANWERRP